MSENQPAHAAPGRTGSNSVFAKSRRAVILRVPFPNVSSERRVNRSPRRDTVSPERRFIPF